MLSFVFLTSFSSPKYCKLANRAVRDCSRKLYQEKHLQLIGSGGAYIENVKEIGAHYSSDELVNLETARRYFVEAMEEYSNRINSDEKIRPYLANYPFGIKNLDIILSFPTVQDKRCDEYPVCLVFRVTRGIIFYEGYDIEKKELIDLYSEPYEEAVRIVHASRQA